MREMKRHLTRQLRRSSVMMERVADMEWLVLAINDRVLYPDLSITCALHSLIDERCEKRSRIHMFQHLLNHTFPHNAPL
jgi:hypothetical protein